MDQANDKPATKCYLDPEATGPVLKKIVFVNGGKEVPWVRDRDEGPKLTKAFCSGLLYAKFRSEFQSTNAAWSKLVLGELFSLALLLFFPFE